jgi:hypothetical protein
MKIGIRSLTIVGVFLLGLEAAEAKAAKGTDRWPPKFGQGFK